MAMAMVTPAVRGQEPDPPTPPDSVVALPELTVPIGRLRVGAVPATRTPFPVQTVRFDPEGDGPVASALGALPGVTLGNQTGSGGQPDIRVRGFTVSPVVGLPQSVSVFVDGVRVNEADASQVHLSLVPEAALERLDLLRGPVGAFGKNALAGALHLVTRRGGDGSLEIEAEGGSFGSMAGFVRSGGRRGRYDALAVASYARSDGWRDVEASREISLFGKLGWRGTRTDAWLSYTLESDSLEGPGPLPESWIAGAPLPAGLAPVPSDRRRLQFTGGGGDAFRSRMHFVNGHVERQLSDVWSLQSTTYARVVDFRQSNDNVTEPDALGLTDIASFGSTAQLSYTPADGLLVLAGAEAVRNRVDIDIRELPNAAFPDVAPGTTERLRTDEDNLAGFAEVWWAPGPAFGIHASLRFDWTSLPVTDLLDPSDSGENTFRQLSGGVGISGDLGAGLGGFAGYGRGFRAPVILEVSCADPEDPCQLPFELGPDPPLRPVTADTWQAGIRWGRSRLRGELVGYWTEVHDDIFNVVDLETPTRGFFTNLDRTRRVGVELLAEGAPFAALAGLTLSGSLGWTRATFQSSATLSAPFVDEDDDDPLPLALQTRPGEGELDPPVVEPGDRFPMIPELSVTAGLEYAAGSTVVALDARWVGEQILVGDEGNDAPFGDLDAYTLLDARVERGLGRVTAFVAVSNVLDSDFSRFGILSRNVRSSARDVERFLTPGRPRAVRVGVRVRAGG